MTKKNKPYTSGIDVRIIGGTLGLVTLIISIFIVYTVVNSPPSETINKFIGLALATGAVFALFELR